MMDGGWWATGGSGAGVSPAAPGVSPANGTPTSVGWGTVPEPAEALPDKSGVPRRREMPTSVGLGWAADENFAGGTPAPLLLRIAGGTRCATRRWTLDFGLWTPTFRPRNAARAQTLRKHATSTPMPAGSCHWAMTPSPCF